MFSSCSLLLCCGTRPVKGNAPSARPRVSGTVLLGWPAARAPVFPTAHVTSAALAALLCMCLAGLESSMSAVVASVHPLLCAWDIGAVFFSARLLSHPLCSSLQDARCRCTPCWHVGVCTWSGHVCAVVFFLVTDAAASASCAHTWFGQTVQAVITESYPPCYRPATDHIYCSLPRVAAASYTRHDRSFTGAVHPRWYCFALIVDSLSVFLSWMHTLRQLQGLRWSCSMQLAVGLGVAVPGSPVVPPSPSV